METMLLYILFLLFGFCANFVIITKYGPPNIRPNVIHKYDMYLTAALSLLIAPVWFVLAGIWFLLMLIRGLIGFVRVADAVLFEIYIKVATKIQNL